MSATSHDPRRDDLAAYLLGALDPTEVADLEGHLAGCEECRRELRACARRRWSCRRRSSGSNPRPGSAAG